MTATLTIDGRDFSAVAFNAVVTVGRDDAESQPEASVLGVEMEGWRGAGQLGNSVVLADSLGQIFAGVVTDFASELDGASGQWHTRLSAVGPLANLGRVFVGDDPWPQESDSQRIKRVLDLVGAPSFVDPNIYGPQVLATDIDHRTAMDVCEEAASSALGIMWEQPSDATTPIRYQPQRLRAWGPVHTGWAEVDAGVTWATVTPASLSWSQWSSDVIALPGAPGELVLNARSILAEVQFSQNISNLVRCVRVAYGLAPDAGERPQEVAGSGLPEIKWETVLADSGGALTVADSIMRAHREPAWQLNQIALPLHDLPPATVTAIRGALAIGLRLTVEGIDFDSPVGSMWQGYLEGWQHEIGGDYHTLTLRTSDRKLTEPSDRWQDVAPALTWGAVSAAETWNTAVEVS